MNVLFYGIIIFLTALFIHFIFWKFYLPKNQTMALLVIFCIVLTLGVAISCNKAYCVNFLNILKPYGIIEYIQLLFLFSSLSLAYTVTYSAIEVDSPSLLIISHIAQNGKAGLAMSELEQLIMRDALITNRINDLLAGKFIALDNKIYIITPKGRVIANIFILYRKILRIPKGG